MSDCLSGTQGNQQEKRRKISWSKNKGKGPVFSGRIPSRFKIVVLPRWCRKWVCTQDMRNIPILLKIWLLNNNVLDFILFYFMKDVNTQTVTNMLHVWLIYWNHWFWNSVFFCLCCIWPVGNKNCPVAGLRNLCVCLSSFW